MKATIVLTTILLGTVSAYRCKFDRISNGVLSQLCSDSDKVADQTESDSCSKSHSNSCYKVHHDTPGDANCHLEIYTGGSCNTPAFSVPCIPGQQFYAQFSHRYKVICN